MTREVQGWVRESALHVVEEGEAAQLRAMAPKQNSARPSLCALRCGVEEEAASPPEQQTKLGAREAVKASPSQEEPSPKMVRAPSWASWMDSAASWNPPSSSRRARPKLSPYPIDHADGEVQVASHPRVAQA